MIIAITGTPGTGKTTVAQRLANGLSYQYVAVNDVAHELPDTEPDLERDTIAVDTDSLVEALQEQVEDDAVLDGHLAHHFPADVTVVLRCNPDELEQRLEAKGWSREKIVENVEAELLDVVLQQAVQLRDTVVEVDTTGKQAEAVVEEIKKLARNPDVDAYRPGQVSWNLDRFPGDD